MSWINSAVLPCNIQKFVFLIHIHTRFDIEFYCGILWSQDLNTNQKTLIFSHNVFQLAHERLYFNHAHISIPDFIQTVTIIQSYDSKNINWKLNVMFFLVCFCYLSNKLWVFIIYNKCISRNQFPKLSILSVHGMGSAYHESNCLAVISNLRRAKRCDFSRG